MITSCECYVDAPCCMALKGLQYKIRYSRSKDTETIYFKTNLNPDTFKSTIVFLKSDLNIELGANCKPIKDNRCGVNAQFPNKTVACDTNFVFLKNNKAFHTTYCTKSLKTNMENRSLFCPILAEFNKHNILYSVQSQDVLQSKAKINIITTDIIPVHDKWVLDTIYMQGLMVETILCV